MSKEQDEIIELAIIIHKLDCAFSDDEKFSWAEANHEFYEDIAKEMLARFGSSKGTCRLTILHLIDLVTKALK